MLDVLLQMHVWIVAGIAICQVAIHSPTVIGSVARGNGEKNNNVKLFADLSISLSRKLKFY